jgi:hypothetical protein
MQTLTTSSRRTPGPINTAAELDTKWLRRCLANFMTSVVMGPGVRRDDVKLKSSAPPAPNTDRAAGA